MESYCKTNSFLYRAANRLKTNFANAQRMLKDAGNLRSKFLNSNLNHLRVAYNNAYRIQPSLPRYKSARQLLFKANITFDANF